MSAHYKVAWLCDALLVSRSGYYDWKNRCSKPGLREVENTHLRERIREEFARSRQTYGSPRIAHALGCPGRRNRIARLMRLERIFARQRSKYRPMTTDSRHGGPIAPNRLRALVVRRPNQVWATDVTCVLTAQGWLYLVAVLDIFSRRVTRLGHEPTSRHLFGQRRLAHGYQPTSLLSKPCRPLRSRSPVRQRRLPATARPTRPNRFDESKRQLLRQCFYRKLL